MHKRELVMGGAPLADAEKLLIMLHGRGSTAQNILRVADGLNVQDFALIAPQATNNTWYPYSFLVPQKQNQPWLDSALDLLKSLTDEMIEKGILSENIYFIGFSQGACLTLEFTARNPRHYGGIVALTGGLIGDEVSADRYLGDFENTRIFISSGDPDPHIPVERISESEEILTGMNANVRTIIYDQRPHIISNDEIQKVNEFIFSP